MAYQITAESPTEIILTPVLPQLGLVRWAVAVLGLLLLSAGLLPLWLRFGSGADALNLGAGLFAAVGLGLVLMGIGMRPTAGDGPAAFVFDRQRAGVWLRGEATDNAAATAALAPSAADVFLPFTDVAELLVITHSHTSQGRGGSMGRTTYTYEVTLHLHDGSTWALTSASERVGAEADLARLQALVATAATVSPPVPPALPALPAAVTLSQEGGASRLRWRNPVRPVEVLRGLGGMAAFAGVLGVFWTIISGAKEGPPAFVYGVMAFIGLGFGATAVAQVLRWWRDGHRHYGLDFGPDAVAYVEEVLTTGHEALRIVVPRAEWYGLNTSFGVVTTEQHPTVLFLTRAAHAQLRFEQGQRLRVPIGEVMAVVLEAHLARPLRVKQFGLTQRLALVQWVQAEAARQQAER